MFLDLLEKGSTMHDLIRKHVLGEPEKMLVIPEDLLGCWRSLKPVFPLVTYVHTTENPVVHPLLKYRGIIDCVAQFRFVFLAEVSNNLHVCEV